MSTETKIPSIPAVTQTNLTEVARAVKGILDVREGRAGDKLDANVTFRDLVDVGIARIASGASAAGGRAVVPAGPTSTGGYDQSTDMTPPPMPTGLVADSAFSSIMLQWDVPAYANHAYTEVWASNANVIGNAIMIGTSTQSMYVDAVGEPSFERYYWIRFVSQADVDGPYNSTAGVYAKTATDVSGALEALAGQISESELSQALSSRIDLVDAPSSTLGSVAYRVSQEAAARTQALLDEASARANADSSLQTQINTLSAASSGDFQELIAAVQEEQTARIAGDNAEASSRQTLAAQMRGTYAGTDIAQVTTGLLFSEAQARANADSVIVTSVNTLSATVATKNKTYRQAAEPTSGMTAGDVWYDSDDSNKPYRYSGTAWVATDDARIAVNAAAITAEQTARANADSALASQITTLSATVDGNAASLQQEITTRASETGGLFAQYTVKTDIAGHVAGFGLASTANNAAPTSSFIVQADQFAVAPVAISSATAPATNLFKGKVWVDTSVAPSVTRYYTGSAWSVTPQALPFVVQTSPTTLNGVEVLPGVYIPDAYFMNGSIGNAKIGNAAIDDAKVANLSAAKLTAGDGTIGGILKSENYVPGQTGWAVFSGGNAEFSDVVVRGTVYATDGVFSGEVISEAPSGDKARIWSGNVEIYKNVPNVGVTLYKALSRVETGVGANNVQVTIPGYFTSQPKVIVSPADIQLYSSAYANQSQSIQCEARNLVESPVGSMVWKFTPLATLSLAANTGQSVVNQISGTIQTNWTSSNYTTQSNTSSITPSITLASRRGNGTSGVYLYRTVRWRVEYLQGGSWVNGAWFTTNLGADANASIISTGTLAFPGAGTWTFRIYAEAYDTNGTTFGSAAYTDSVVTRSRSDTVTQSVLRGSSGTKSLAYAPPSYSVPAGSTLLGIDFSYVYSYSMECEFGGSSRAEISGNGILYQNQNSSGYNITKSWNNRSSNTLTFIVLAYFDNLGPRYSSASLTLHSATAYWRIRTPNAASSTAENNFSFNSYSFSLTSAQVLATGTLNWVAIGE